MKTKIIANNSIEAENAVKIVKIVEESKCECSMTRGYWGKTVSADSILMLLSLGIRKGDIVTIASDNADCVRKICDILQEIEIERVVV